MCRDQVWEVDSNGRSQHKLLRTLSGHAHRVNTLALNCVLMNSARGRFR